VNALEQSVKMSLGERGQLIAIGLAAIAAVLVAPIVGLVFLLAAIPVVGTPFLWLLAKAGFGR